MLEMDESCNLHDFPIVCITGTWNHIKKINANVGCVCVKPFIRDTPRQLNRHMITRRLNTGCSIFLR